MDKKTEYGKWLSAQMINQNAEVNVLEDKPESNTYEAESGYYSAIAAQQLEQDSTALKLQSMSLSSDHKWHEIAAESTNTLSEIGTDCRVTSTRVAD